MREISHYGVRPFFLTFRMAILCCVILVGGMKATAQTAAKQISLECNHTPLSSALKKIEKASGLKIIFTYDEVQNYHVTVSIVRQPVEQVLKIILKGTPFSYSIKGKFINIKQDTATSHVSLQDRKITGNVTDENNEPLIGATIRVYGRENGTVTDSQGRFNLNIPAETSQIEVSYVGMHTQIVSIQKRNSLNIVMKENQQVLDDVIVTGYQTLSRERSTGAFGKVDTKRLELKRMDNLSNMLEGEVAGYVNGYIRGVSTMRAISNPLVVIDGFPVENTSMDQSRTTTENMPDINPEDIESITVLKDAAAASIYGARAANGVIVITTKKGKPGKMDISFSTTFTIQPYSFYTKNRTDASDIISLEREWASRNSALLAGGDVATSEAADIRENGTYPSEGVNTLLDMYTNRTSQEEGNKILDNLASKGYQYYDQVKRYTKRNPFYQQYNLRISKNTDRNITTFSTSYWKNKYEDINHGDWKLGLNLTNSLKITKWLQADLGVYLKYGETDTQSYNALSPGFNALPYDALANADGSYIAARSQSTQERRDLIEQNGLKTEVLTPMDELNYNLAKTKTLETRANAKLKIDFTPWLNYHIMFQYETNNDKQELLKEEESYDMITLINNYTSLSAYNTLVYNVPEGDGFYTQLNEKRAYNFRQQLNLAKTFDKHDITWILGQELRHTKLFYENDMHYGYDSELLTWPTINETSLKNVSAILGRRSSAPFTQIKNELLNRFVSFYSNGSYTYNEKYTLSGSIRWDKSNLWGRSSRYQNRPLWSVGGSWNVSKESFFHHADFLDMLKLRASYGIGGNIGRNTAPYLVAGYFASYEVPGLAGYVQSPPNKDIRWEKTTTINIGADFALFNHRLTGSVEYYNKKSVDLLAMINGSPTQGFGQSVLTTNNGAMTNHGLEITLHGTLIRKKNLSWDATLLYAYNKNKVTKVSLEPTSYEYRLSLPNSYPTEGEALYGIYGYQWAGLDANGEPQVYDAAGNITSNAVQDVEAIKYCGTSLPIHSSTLTNVLRYKNLELSAMLILQAGHKLRDANIPSINMTSGRITSTSIAIRNRWQQPGDENTTHVPRLLFSNEDAYNTYRSTQYRYSDLFIYNASNIRIRNISIAYRLPSQWCKKIFLSGAKLQFNVENVATVAFDSRAHYTLGGKQKPNYVWGINLNF